MAYGYGFFHGGDPRKFHPDHDSCSEQELKNHAAACALWDEAEARGETPTPESSPSGFVYDDAGNLKFHVLCAPYGIGMYEYEDQPQERARCHKLRRQRRKMLHIGDAGWNLLGAK